MITYLISVYQPYDSLLNQSMNQSIDSSIDVSYLYQSTYLFVSICLPSNPSISSPISQSIYRSGFCQSIYLHLSIYLKYLSIYLAIYLAIYLQLSIYSYLSTTIYLQLSIYINLFIFVNLYMYVYPAINRYTNRPKNSSIILSTVSSLAFIAGLGMLYSKTRSKQPRTVQRVPGLVQRAARQWILEALCCLWETFQVGQLCARCGLILENMHIISYCSQLCFFHSLSIVPEALIKCTRYSRCFVQINDGIQKQQGTLKLLPLQLLYRCESGGAFRNMFLCFLKTRLCDIHWMYCLGLFFWWPVICWLLLMNPAVQLHSRAQITYLKKQKHRSYLLITCGKPSACH